MAQHLHNIHCTLLHIILSWFYCSGMSSPQAVRLHQSSSHMCFYPNLSASMALREPNSKRVGCKMASYGAPGYVTGWVAVF